MKNLCMVFVVFFMVLACEDSDTIPERSEPTDTEEPNNTEKETITEGSEESTLTEDPISTEEPTDTENTKEEPTDTQDTSSSSTDNQQETESTETPTEDTSVGTEETDSVETDTDIDTASLVCYKGDLLINYPSTYDQYKDIECVLGELTIDFGDSYYGNINYDLEFNSLLYVSKTVRITNNRYHITSVSFNKLKRIDSVYRQGASCSFGIIINGNGKLRRVSFHSSLYIDGKYPHGQVSIYGNLMLFDMSSLITADITNAQIQKNPLLPTCQACEIVWDRRAEEDVNWLTWWDIIDNLEDKCFVGFGKYADCNRLYF